MTRPLDAIFFDIDDTLFSTSVFADKARRAALDAMIAVGLRSDRDSLQRELQEVLVEFSSNYGNHFDKLLLRLPPEASANLNPALIVAAGVVAYHETKWSEFKVYDDVYEVLGWLANRKPIRGVISAGLSIKQAEKIIRLKIYEFLSPNAIFITEQVGINKPNPKVYRRALKELGLEPGRTMYVGDNPTHDIDPCNDIGMMTVRIRRSGKHSEEVGRSDPDFEVRDFYGLREILRTEFGI
ncbi:MAG: HAD-IA family hydrolase [Planctomycetota bacterium]|jgi:putative hydrolase of the HAD superfamily